MVAISKVAVFFVHYIDVEASAVLTDEDIISQVRSSEPAAAPVVRRRRRSSTGAVHLEVMTGLNAACLSSCKLPFCSHTEQEVLCCL